MPGYFYYIAVSVMGLALAVFVICKNKNRVKLITFYLFSALFADCGEVLALLLLNAYSYKLDLFTNPWADNIWGHLLPNNTLWPAVAVFIAAYAPRFRWIISISVLFIMLDILFIQLGVYVHHWWQSWMSGVAVFLYCIIMRFWYSKLEDNKFKILRFFTFSSMFTIIMFLPTATLLLADKEFYRVGIYTNLYKDSITFSFLFDVTVSPLSITFLCILKKWYWKLVPFIIFIAGDLLFMSFGILNFLNGWNIFYLIIIRAICLLIFIKIEEKYSYNPARSIS